MKSQHSSSSMMLAETVHIICDAYSNSNEPTITDLKPDMRENAKLHTPFKDAIKPVQQISILHFCLRRSSLH